MFADTPLAVLAAPTYSAAPNVVKPASPTGFAMVSGEIPIRMEPPTPQVVRKGKVRR